MTAVAHDAEKPRELDADTRRAWSAYSEQLRELVGEEYERAEQESWTELADRVAPARASPPYARDLDRPLKSRSDSRTTIAVR